ncbi:molybdenum cofactor guanylyltransferase [Haloarchaeobius baliensis]|uniref:molybdenum cofactor guanylyltransferase n=1 Tax=Haloarchaeobius baliensis TaxID=1670458 RepID=UPI003F880C15
MTSDGITAVVLVGGDSTRFEDGHKASATFEGRTFLRRVLDAVAAVSTEPPVLAFRSDAQRRSVLDAVEDVTGDGVQTAIDDDGFRGPLAGLYGAIEAVETSWLFLCACDMPLVSATAITYLSERWRDGVDAVVPVDPTGGYEPLFALFRCESLLDAESELPRAAGVRALVAQLEVVETVPLESAPPQSGLTVATTNVNTKADLRRLSE